MAIYRLGQKIKELFIRGRSIAKVYDHGRLVFSKGEVTPNYTFSINPKPTDAKVVITRGDTGVSVTGKTVTVPAGTSISWRVSKTGYTAQSGSLTLNSNVTRNVTLVRDESAARWWCYHYYGRIPGQYSANARAHFYFYIQPNVTSGAKVYGAGQKASNGNYTIDIVCTSKGTKLYQATAVYFAYAPYLIKSKTASAAKIYPKGTSPEGAGVITGERDTSGDIY